MSDLTDSERTGSGKCKTHSLKLSIAWHGLAKKSMDLSTIHEQNWRSLNDFSKTTQKLMFIASFGLIHIFTIVHNY